ncbi:thioredoxin [Desulfofarcimen acetoxidans DSM 771]|jgi:thioredoxin 1|uniref:Thioredoxin n=1 Tax=Desulfofarcimen acetoxidans (strain ATCC 49208 / DSM 771 / KCTC 5769 / VKM B-1644 / 5575) TaxID=485916 RepID=C8VZU2_DESAS|nr:thioredoxin [Desulfofarcimen acetoxidans]ACV63070.1 thioredoxin [Desulfofarcimen acetoxidans DSM 771]
MALEVNQSNFESEVLKASEPVVVDFWAPWCGPCRSMAPVIEELAKDFEGKAKIAKLNVDENQALAGQFGVMSIPTLIFFKDGKAVDTVVGFTPKNKIAEKINAII